MDSSHFIAEINSIKNEISIEKESLKRNLKELSQAENQVKKVATLLKSKQWCALYGILRDKKQFLPAELYEHLDSFVQIEIKTLWKSYPILLEEAFAKVGLPLDKVSRHPQYSLSNSLLQIEIEENRCLATIRSLSGKTLLYPADVLSVSATAKKHYQRITKQRFEPQAFLLALNSAYHKAQPDAENEPFLPIKKVFSQFVRKNYAIDEFAYDFSHFIRSGIKSVNDEYLEIQHSKDENRGIMLNGISPRLLIGAISFKRKLK
jgi:hypothetical protein